MGVNTGVGADRIKNCAMCTIAAVLGRDTTYVQKLVKARGQSDDALLAAWGIRGDDPNRVFAQVTDQIYRLIYIELRKTIDPWMGYRSGAGLNELQGALTLGLWMNGFAEGTRFAVWGSDPIGIGPHWNYARKQGSDIQFRDYQYNHGNNPPKSNTSFIAPEGQELVMTDEQYKRFLALAYTTVPDRRARLT